MAFGGLQLYIVYTAFISPVEFPYFPPDFAAYTICFLGNPLFIIERHGASASSPAKVMEASLPKGTAVMPRKNGDEATEKR